jgi:hypothetical protein
MCFEVAHFFANTITTPSSETTKICHMHLGYMSAHGMAELSKRGLIDGCHAYTPYFCEYCVFDKHNRVKFRLDIHNTESILDYVHIDLLGPLIKPLLVVLAICSLLLMITHEEFSLIFLNTNQKHLSPSKHEGLWLKSKLSGR